MGHDESLLYNRLMKKAFPPFSSAATKNKRNAAMNQRQFLLVLKEQFATLTPQQKIIAQFIDQNAHRIALLKIQELASECGVQPSAVVRFAKRFNFIGFIPLQQLFKEHATENNSPRLEYQKRISSWAEKSSDELTPAQVAQSFIQGCQLGLQELITNVDVKALTKAITGLRKADGIWVVAMRRSFAVGAYLVYSLQNLQKPTTWLTGMGAMDESAISRAKDGDWLIAVSFAPYAQETLNIVQSAVSKGMNILAITDSNVSPLAHVAKVTLLTQEHSTFNFRSLSNSMCLAQSIIVGMAHASTTQ